MTEPTAWSTGRRPILTLTDPDRLDPREPGDHYKYALYTPNDNVANWSPTWYEGLATALADSGSAITDAALMGWSRADIVNDIYSLGPVRPIVGAGVFPPQAHQLHPAVVMHFNAGHELFSGVGHDFSLNSCTGIAQSAAFDWWRRAFNLGDGASGLVRRVPSGTPFYTAYGVTETLLFTCSGGDDHVRGIPDVPVLVSTAVLAPEGALDVIFDNWNTVGLALTRPIHTLYDPAWIGESAGAHLPPKTDAPLVLPRDPALPIGHPDYESEEYWTAAYNDAVAAGEVPSGWTYNPANVGNTYPAPVPILWGLPLPPPGTCAPEVTVGQVVHELATRAGVPPDKIDVSELTELIYGHAAGRPSTARRIIEQLQMYGMFSLVDRGDHLKAVLRSRSPEIVVPYADLGAHEEGEEPPPRLAIRRTQDPELPRTMRLMFAQISADMEEGQAAYTRQQTTSINTRDVQLPIAMSDTKAAQIPEIWVTVEWIGRETVTFSLPAVDAYRDELFPGVPVTLTQESGDTLDVMISRRTYTFPGLLQFEGRRHDPAAYESEAVGAAPIRPPSILLPPGDTAGFLIDGPMLRDEDDNAGYYAAMYGGSTWRGGTLFRSTDGGATYDPVASLSRPGTIGGVVDDPVPAGPTTIWDMGNEIVVQIIPGRELESRSVEDVIAGANAAAYQVRDGQGQTIGWEILQFVDATQTDDDEYTLTTLLRGRRGTEWAVGLHQAGDVLLMLANIARVPSQLSDVGQDRPHRAVSFGLSVDDALTLPFTPRGRSLQPFSPVHIRGARDGAGDLTITWVRRSRTAEALHNGVDTPLGEDAEAYEVDILDGATVVRTISVADAEAVYTAAQQSSDFGGAQGAVDVRVYQISAQVGRGVPGEATV